MTYSYNTSYKGVRGAFQVESGRIKKISSDVSIDLCSNLVSTCSVFALVPEKATVLLLNIKKEGLRFYHLTQH